MKKIFFLLATNLLSIGMWAGVNGLQWDYSSAAPSSNPDNGLYFASAVNDASGTKGIKMNKDGYAYFTKAAYPGWLTLTFGPRNSGTSVSLQIHTWSGETPQAETQIATTNEVTQLTSFSFELTAEQNNIYISRLASKEAVLQSITLLYVDPVGTDPEPEPDPQTILRLVPGQWKVDGAKFAAWVWGNGIDGAWTDFFTGTDTMSVAIEGKPTNIIFCRFSFGAAAPSWEEEMWNKTADLTINYNGLMYAITGWNASDGHWIEPEPEPEPEAIKPVTLDFTDISSIDEWTVVNASLNESSSYSNGMHDIYSFDTQAATQAEAYVTAVPDIRFSYTNSGAKNNAFYIAIADGSYGYYQFNGKNGIITIQNTKKDDIIRIKVAAKGSSDASFQDDNGVYPINAVALSVDLTLPRKGSNAISDEEDSDGYIWRTLVFRSLGGDVALKEFSGGFRIREIKVARSNDAQSEYLGEVSIQEFLNTKDTKNSFQLTGVVRNVRKNDSYGYFTLIDETGSITINGLLTDEGDPYQFDIMDVGEGDTLTLRGVYALQSGKPCINEALYVDHKIHVGPVQPLGNYQIVGGFTNGWNPADGIEFQNVDGVLTANVSKIEGAFKIVKDRNWDTNWGANGDYSFEIGETYALKYIGDNIEFDNPFAGYRNAVLTLVQDRTGDYFLTLVSGEFEPLVADWYLPNGNDWVCNEKTKLIPVPGTENQYIKHLDLLHGAVKVVCGEWEVEFGAYSSYLAGPPYTFDIWGSEYIISSYHDNVTARVTIDYETPQVKLEILDETEVYTVPASLFTNWAEGHTAQVKLTGANAKTSISDMAEYTNDLYYAWVFQPEDEIVSIQFIHLDENGNQVEQIEALKGAILYNDNWEEYLFARVGMFGYWMPVPERKVSIRSGVAIYFDNSQTNWENVYLRVGSSKSHGYASNKAMTWPMNHVENTDLWYAVVDQAFNDEEVWMITDKQGDSGEGKDVFSLPMLTNVIMPDIDDIIYDQWIVAQAGQTAQTYLIWKYWKSEYGVDEIPTYTLTNIPDTLHEGETIKIGVQCPIPFNYDRYFDLGTEEWDERIQITPSELVMPPMATYAEFEVSIKDDDEPQKELKTAFWLYESSDNFYLTTKQVCYPDDDMPQISLELSQTTIAEYEESNILTATIRRHTLLDRSVKVYLEDDSENRIYYFNDFVKFESGESEKTIQFRILDDTQAQGTQTITLFASVYIPSCGCIAEPPSVGYAEQALTIEDDDEPALTLQISNNMLQEGKEEAAWLTVMRNTSTLAELVVSLAVDHPEGLTFPATVTIPAGFSSIDVAVGVERNGTADDSHSIAFSATCEGFIPAACYAMVVDQTLPDALVELIYEGAAEVEVNQEIEMIIKVSNEGAAGLAKGVRVMLYSSASDEPVGIYSLSAKLPIDAYVTIPATAIMPSRIGTYRFYAVVNEDRQVKELLYYNNSSENISINTIPPFAVTDVHVDKTAYMPGETVQVSGHASGSQAANTEVEIYAVNNGWRTAFRVMTDANGDFQGVFTPQAGQNGHFAIGACFPSENSYSEMASANFYGMEPPRQPATCQIISGYTYNSSISVRNVGALPIHNVKALLEREVTDCDIQFEPVSVIAAGSTAELHFSLYSTKPTQGTDWQKVNITISCDEGLEAPNAIYYFCQNPKGQLGCSISEIRTNIAARDESNIIFYLSNTGLGETGEIRLALPSWMQSLTGNTIPSIPSGEYAQVTLRTIPNEMFENNLNSPITGHLGINPTNCEGMSLPFSVTPVSDKIGILHVDVCDENTYYTEQKPHVSGAQVLIKSIATGAVIAQGVTNEAGIFEVELSEGFYGISVSANDHDSYSNNLFVQPSGTTNITVNLSIRAIEISWEVVETEVEDEYEIVTTVTYETQVPKPVVVVDAPTKIDADLLQDSESLMYTVKVTNEGLIRAEDVTITLPDGGDALLFEALAYSEPFNLEAKQSVDVPVRVTRINGSDDAPDSARKIHAPIECNGNMLMLYYWDCGTDRKWHQYGVPLIYKKCDGGKPSTVDGTDTSGGGGGGGWSWCPWCTGGGPYSCIGCGDYKSDDDDDPPTIKDEGCEPCQNKFILDLVSCGLGFTPIGTFLNIAGMVAGCYTAARQNYDENKSIFRAVGACLDDLVEPITDMFEDKTLDAVQDRLSEKNGKRLGRARLGMQLVGCLKDLLGPCTHTAENAADAPKRMATQETAEEDEYADEPEYLARFKRRALFAHDEVLSWQNYLDQYVLPDMQDYISIKELMDLLTAWNIALMGDLDRSTLDQYRPAALPDEMWEQLIERMNNTYQFMNGNTAISDNFINPETMVSYLQKIAECEQKANEWGFANTTEMYEHESNLLDERLNNKSENVCATITLQFEQKMAMTRQAFRGTLTVFNGHETTAMTNVHLTLDVYDENGKKATDKEFAISLEKLEGMSGEVSLDAVDGWTIGSQETGVATILFIPTKYAAPTKSIVYSFGGQLSYTDPFSGLTVTRDLYPVQLTVNPSPQLELTYFMQRDVFSDDPLTITVEPAQPTEFALLINNIGYGDATNVRMTTMEPKIVDNEKGLLIDFHLLYSLHEGKEKALPINENIVTEFGTIPAQEQTYAQWFFESTLLGHFIEYDVAYTHLTSYGNPDLSLIDNVSVHEMIHSIGVPASEPTHVGWLANDDPDGNHTPDALYISDGSIVTVNLVETAILDIVDDHSCIVTCVPATAGWNYGIVEAPEFNGQEILSVTRLSDDASISLRNVWQTPCILIDGGDPVHINRIHVADNMSNTQEYRIVFGDKSSDIGTDYSIIRDKDDRDAHKFIRNDHLYILTPEGRIFNAAGMQVK